METVPSRLDEFVMQLSRRQFDTSGHWPVDLSGWEDARGSDGLAGDMARGRAGDELAAHGIVG